MKVIVVGAGLAGLTCASHLLRYDMDVTVLEASDDVGGRVRSDRQGGFILDRGFQVLFDSYTSLKNNLNIESLGLRPFDPGAVICKNGRQSIIADPLRETSYRYSLATAFNPAISPSDKIRILTLSKSLRTSGASANNFDDISTHAYLRSLGFSETTIKNFFKPFFGGIFLDTELNTNASVFRYYFQMLSSGYATLPAQGMGSISTQMATPLTQQNRIHFDSRVTKLIIEREKVNGVIVNHSKEIKAHSVVIATEADTAHQLTSIPTVDGALGATVAYFAGDRALSQLRKIYINANEDAYVNSVQLLSNISPTYAPTARHLLSAAIIGIPQNDEDIIKQEAFKDIEKMFASDREALRSLTSYSPIAVYRIPYAQFPQPPVSETGTATNSVHLPSGLYFAGEWLETSSIDGAISSGETTASKVWMDYH